MRYAQLKTIILVTILCISSACAQLTTNNIFFQRLEFGDYGQGAVRDVEITYSGKIFPSGIAHRNFDPNHMATVSESWDLSIPENSVIRWISADGVQHEVTAPIRNLVADPAYFQGFRFSFVDDHVVIYVLNRTRYWPKDLDIEATQVYISEKADKKT